MTVNPIRMPSKSTLDAMSVDDLIVSYNELTTNNSVPAGAGFWLDEVGRRADRQIQQQMRWMTVAILVLTFANVVLVGVSVA